MTFIKIYIYIKNYLRLQHQNDEIIFIYLLIFKNKKYFDLNLHMKPNTSYR